MAMDLNALIKSLVEVQECRQANRLTMKLASVRIETFNKQYYAKVNITGKAIRISPYDVNISDQNFRPVHLIGADDREDRVIKINTYNEGVYVVHFRTDKQRDRAMKRVKRLIGYITF
ncbi:uncharacterized protein LOC135141926 [Zophobas morio]|uniref:uncharacterized protein LOC135141926 n=1 Tax=Zophobas morio TaxID=2755281 RepID=UPI0030832E5C